MLPGSLVVVATQQRQDKREVRTQENETSIQRLPITSVVYSWVECCTVAFGIRVLFSLIFTLVLPDIKAIYIRACDPLFRYTRFLLTAGNQTKKKVPSSLFT